MRLVLYNPHVDDFIFEPIIYRFFNRRPLKKYGFIQKIENICIYVDETESGIIPFKFFRYFPTFFKKIIIKSEIKYWKKINDCKISFFESHKKNDVLFFMSYKTANNLNEKRLSNINKFEKKISLSPER